MHSCPDCGQACYCGGDIDDCDFGDEEAVINCMHYIECEQEESADYDESEPPPSNHREV